MADGILNIDTGKANEWSGRVNEEIARTNTTLKEVTEVCNEFPGDNDFIMKSIQATGSVLQKAYDDTAKAFKDAWQEIARGIVEFSKVTDKITENFDELTSKVGK